ncbi:unnamed protein product, partial [Brassica rapa]
EERGGCWCKDLKEVDKDFFLVVVKILDHQVHVASDVPALAECVRLQSHVPEGYELLIDYMANIY